MQIQSESAHCHMQLDYANHHHQIVKKHTKQNEN